MASTYTEPPSLYSVDVRLAAKIPIETRSSGATHCSIFNIQPLALLNVFKSIKFKKNTVKLARRQRYPVKPSTTR